jgi:hypothetical protein
MKTYNKLTVSVSMGDEALDTPEKAQLFLVDRLGSVVLPEESGSIICRDVNGNTQTIEIDYDVDEEEEEDDGMNEYRVTVVETRKVTCEYIVRAADDLAAQDKAKKGECEESDDLSIDEVIDREVESVEENTPAS